jgi:hypothetical protein
MSDEYIFFVDCVTDFHVCAGGDACMYVQKHTAGAKQVKELKQFQKVMINQ